MRPMQPDYVPALAPEVRKRLFARADRHDIGMLAEVMAKVPRHLAPRFLDEWEKRLDTQGRYASNWYLTSLPFDVLPELFLDTALPFDATEDDIAEAAIQAARHVRCRIRMNQPGGDVAVWAALGRVARRYQVKLPATKALAGTIARMTDKAWWRRALRKRFQMVEHAAIKAGYVHKRAASYVSDEAMRRHARHALKVSAMLEKLEAVNESTGECASLSDLRDTSTANPTIRRKAMMAIIAGLEEHAKALGFVPLFLTITCPSRMHSRLAQSGDANPRYDGTSPRQSQNYLARAVWNSAMRSLKHRGIAPGTEFFGLRTVEPHHDATPHWHVLAFVAPHCAETFTDTLRRYALADTPEEPGAAERRFTVKTIDPAKGSAVGYIAKYISKSTDGEGVGTDNESEAPASSSAPRIVVWARHWNVRQFQFFGTGTVSPFRELWRLNAVPDTLRVLLSPLWQASQDGDFAAYMAARDSRKTRLRLLYEAADSQRYPGEQVKRMRGLLIDSAAGSMPVITRPDRWIIQRREDSKNADFAAPWTRINNSAPVDLTGFFRVSDSAKQRTKHPEKQGHIRSIREGLGSALDRAPLPGQGHAYRKKAGPRITPP